MSAIAVFGGGYPTERGNVRGEGTCPAFMDGLLGQSPWFVWILLVNNGRYVNSSLTQTTSATGRQPDICHQRRDA